MARWEKLKKNEGWRGWGKGVVDDDVIPAEIRNM